MQCIFSRNTFNVFYSTLQVMVSLSESDHKLILQIQDNGIGFDPATVEQGLHSMCTRISRIGGGNLKLIRNLVTQPFR